MCTVPTVFAEDELGYSVEVDIGREEGGRKMRGKAVSKNTYWEERPG